jgi:catechol 2,3-dioxygenase
MLIDRRAILAATGVLAMSNTILPVPPAAAALPRRDPLAPGMVTLIVRNLDTVARYYEETIGLHRIDAEFDTVRLGAGGKVLLALHWRDVDLEPAGFAGLFHTAFLMPARADLGRWVARAVKSGTRFDGASDHIVSEALYLTDPEGNGIEVYADRPRATWQWRNGEVTMATNALDLESLVAAGGVDPPNTASVPDGTTVGHVHLRVGGLPESERFYRDVVGLDVTTRYPGATFYATGGYHHHIATNIWRSRNAPRRSGTTTGLASFELVAADKATFHASAERLLAIGARRKGDAIEAEDPWGNAVVLRRG